MKNLAAIASRVAARVHVGMDEYNRKYVNKLVSGTEKFLAKVKAAQKTAEIRDAFEDFFEVWQDVDAGFDDSVEAGGNEPKKVDFEGKTYVYTNAGPTKFVIQSPVKGDLIILRDQSDEFLGADWAPKGDDDLEDPVELALAIFDAENNP